LQISDKIPIFATEEKKFVMTWFFIILGLMILGCMVMAVKDEKKYGYSKRRIRKKKKGYSYEEYRKIVMS
jgi:hypothetical protein